MIRKLCGVLTILFLLGAGALSAAYYLYYVKSLDTEIVMVIPKNKSTHDIAGLMESTDVVSDLKIFEAIAFLHLKRKRYIQPGEYLFEKGSNLSIIFHKILTGDRLLRHITFPEGYTNFQIINVLNNAYGLEGDVVIPIPEGTLMPDTYYYYYGEARVHVVSAMNKTMSKFLDEQWGKRASSISVASKQDALILASVIEKETRIPAERARVSSVFNNRLRIGMPLQADPTVIYGLHNGQTDFEYRLTKEDMRHNSPYNTYINRGLPPSPICNPSRASIIAALNPEQTSYLYFVADGTGGHAFSTNYDDHRRNIQKTN